MFLLLSDDDLDSSVLEHVLAAAVVRWFGCRS